jgi:hypothetical protein
MILLYSEYFKFFRNRIYSDSVKDLADIKFNKEFSFI